MTTCEVCGVIFTDWPGSTSRLCGWTTCSVCGARAIVHERDELRAEVARLRAIVDKLPKTADGVVVTIGMRVWTKDDCAETDDDFEGWIVTGIGPELAVEHQHYDWVRTNGNGWLTTGACYSTREAAKAGGGE